jgi:hypothetical protein
VLTLVDGAVREIGCFKLSLHLQLQKWSGKTFSPSEEKILTKPETFQEQKGGERKNGKKSFTKKHFL